MDSKVSEIFENKQENFLLPFYWQMGDHTDKIPQHIETICNSGCKAVCVESRTHPKFGEKEWFDDLRLILDECKKRDMKVWILDDDHFPTGHANGGVTRHRELRKLSLAETHVDCIGPIENASTIIRKFEPEDEVLGVFMYRRERDDESICDDFVDLTDKIKDNFVYFDVPEGVYRIFILFKTHFRANDHIDMINPRSTDLQIKEVYEPHYNELKEYFGNTLAGFFSDEPGFYTEYFKNGVYTRGFYHASVGQVGVLLPYSDELREIMDEKAQYSVLPYLPGLWHNIGEKTAELRHNYMNTLSKLYSRHFTQKIGEWCKGHSVEYIGHIIEDSNANSKISCSAAHYFRAMHGQSMSGMDVVFQQVLPGFAHFRNASVCAGEVVDSEFNHYMLAKMCSSDAHFDREKNGRAMCEVFGAGGWAEGTQMQKWLIDFLLVRGINHFVPHAFSPNFPNHDCPPHFGCEGHDPQFDGFSTLMKYTNKMSNILTGGVHIANALVLYSADGEWGSGDDFMYSQRVCRNLYDNHIDFDVISIDYLKNGTVFDNKFRLNREVFDCLFVPYCAFMSKNNLNVLKNLENVGFDVVFVNDLPKNCDHKFKTVKLDECAKYYHKNFTPDIFVRGAASLLRHYHVRRGAADVYMFFNESVTENVDAYIGVGKVDCFLKLDMLNDSNTTGVSENGEIHLKLTPYQSAVYVFDKFSDGFLSEFPQEKSYVVERDMRLPYEVQISEEKGFENYEKLMVTDKLVNITSVDVLPKFAGKIKYFARFYLEKKGEYLLDLGRVGQNVRLFVNGHDAGIRICKPYIFDISKYTVDGENDFEAIVSNTLGQKIMDDFSFEMVLEPSGLLGPVRLLKPEN